MQTFLLKTEPGEYSFADLQRDGIASWTGITNAAALKALRQARAGDEALLYHTGDEKAIVGLAKIVKGAYPDPKQPGTTAAGETKFPVIDIKAIKPAKKPLPLATIKADARFAEFSLVKQSRLSAMLVPPAVDRVLRSLAGL